MISCDKSLYKQTKLEFNTFKIFDHESSKSASGKEIEDDDRFEYTFGTVKPYENDPIASETDSSSSDEYKDRIPGMTMSSWYDHELLV
jgi:hypothetical protein